MMTRMSGPMCVRLAVYGGLIAFAFGCGVWLPSSTTESICNGIIFLMGPLLVLFDMRAPMQQTRWAHHTETTFRFSLVVWCYWQVLPRGPMGELNTHAPGLCVSFLTMFMAVLFCLRKFTVVPMVWIDKQLSRLVPVSIVQGGLLALVAWYTNPYADAKTLLLWTFALQAMVLHLAWRHALWYNPSQTMSLGQHADVWPRLGKTNTPVDFWRKMRLYNVKHPSPVPEVAFGWMDLPMLLKYFDACLSDPDDAVVNTLEKSVKSAITAKEPRAVFIWEMYGNEDAVRCIQQLDAPEAPQHQRSHMDSLALPAL